MSKPSKKELLKRFGNKKATPFKDKKKTAEGLVSELIDDLLEAKSASLDIDLQKAISTLQKRVTTHFSTRKKNNSFTGGGNKQERKLLKILKLLDTAYTETIDLGW